MNKNVLVFAGMGLEIASLIVGSLYLTPAFESLYPPIKPFGFVFLSGACLVGWLVQIIILLKRMDKDS